MISLINNLGQEIIVTKELLVTKQVASFKEFKIKGDVSLSFDILNNSANRNAVGLYAINQVENPFFSDYKFNVSKDGTIIMTGYLVIESITKDAITCFFVSGNSNWFNKLNFSCKDVRNDLYNVGFTYYWMEATKSNTEGIIFPFVDYMFSRNKFDKYNFLCSVVDDSNESDPLYLPVNISPCLYISTLVNEVSKLSRIKISGTLLDDKLYQSLIVTPSSADLYNSDGQISTILANKNVQSLSGINSTIHIQDIAPDIKAVELIKWLCFTFGCVPVFDEYTQTLTLNLLDKLKKEDSVDWSQYIQDYELRYTQNQNNYVRLQESIDNDIKIYNELNPDALYGELNILSTKNDGSSKDIYTSPFAPVKDDIGVTPLRWATPYVPLYTLTDGDELTYSNVYNVSGTGKAKFDCVFNYDISPYYSCIVRIVDDNNIYTGHHIVRVSEQDSKNIISGCDFIANSSGKLYLQKIEKSSTSPMVLVCVPALNVDEFTSSASLEIYPTGSATNVAYAYYHKPFYNEYADLNRYKAGLSYGYVDITENNGLPLPVPPSLYEVIIYSHKETSTATNIAVPYYRINSGDWIALQSVTLPFTGYSPSQTIYMSLNDVIEVGFQNESNADIEYGSGVFGAFTGYCGLTTPYSATITNDTALYFNINIVSNDFVTC